MGDLFTRNLKKQSNRAKEKLLESFGKADRTTDESFDELNANFVRQQASSELLAKQLRNYVTCVKAMCQASTAVHNALRDVYEPQWPNKEHVQAMTQSLDLLYDDYHEKLQEQAVGPMCQFAAHFSETKTRVDKRGRKLLDYDSARHALMQMHTATKRPDDPKLMKAQENLAVAQQLYSQLNSELLEELPDLYDKRIPVYAHTFQNLYAVMERFNSETAKISGDLASVLEELHLSSDRYKVTRPQPSALPITIDMQHMSTNNKTNTTNGVSPVPSVPESAPSHQSPINNTVYPVLPSSTTPPASPNKADLQQSESEAEHTQDSGAESERVPQEKEPKDRDSAVVNVKESQLSAPEPTVSPTASPRAERRGSSNPHTPSHSPDKEHTLYKVRASHKYTAEDTDELSFEAGELIKVIPFEDPEEQDEGWLMGMKESSGEKGVFPANFTKPL